MPQAPRTRWKEIPLWQVFAALLAFVTLTHITLLRLPYFWDEAGYYIPVAWEFLHTGTLTPHTTLNNAHPPLPSILLAGWWTLTAYAPLWTRLFICILAATALLAVYRIALRLCGQAAAVAVTLLTALYPVWFAQSTLAHADIFAAVFTLWGIATYFEARLRGFLSPARSVSLVLLFGCSVLAKETALITPLLLALYEGVIYLRTRSRFALNLALLCISPVLPLALWYGYHYVATGNLLGDPDYLRYNATGNFSVQRIGWALFHRAIHLTGHMNLFVPVLCALGCFFLGRRGDAKPLPHPILTAIAVLLAGNWIFFSVFGGALLTRYLLPMYPLVLLLCVTTWQQRIREWWPLALFSGAAFIAGLVINPPYHFAPEDNLAYRDMVVLNQQAIDFVQQHYPAPTVLSAWPVTDAMRRPELGYLTTPIRVVAIDNFTVPELQKALAEDSSFDTALLFSTKYDPPSLRSSAELTGAKYFDFHRDLLPAEAARFLHGRIVWEQWRNGEWAAVLRFDRVRAAALHRP